MTANPLQAKRNNDRVIDPVRPNTGLEMQYRRILIGLVDRMQSDLVKAIEEQYEGNKPLTAMDEVIGGNAAKALNKAMQRVARRWMRIFDEKSWEVGQWFGERSTDAGSRQLSAGLSKAGFTVQFKMTRQTQEAMEATIAEQVGLIKSIAQQHLTEVQGLVMRSVQTGRDLSTLSKELQKRYQVTKRRAALIARDQNNKATATITRTRQRELGITTAVWKHSHAGKHPRPSHLAADGKEYEIDKGMFLDGKWVWPGTEINCRCTCRSVIKGL